MGNVVEQAYARSDRFAERRTARGVLGSLCDARSGRLSSDCDTTVQALLGEALNDLFAKHGLPELAERD